MRRPVAVVAFLALLWSQLVAFHCDMGTPRPGTDSATRASIPAPQVNLHAHHTVSGPPATHAQHHPSSGAVPSSPHEQDHGDADGCRMMLACGVAAIRPLLPASLLRVASVFVQAGFLSDSLPGAADVAVETPPPRHNV